MRSVKKCHSRPDAHESTLRRKHAVAGILRTSFGSITVYDFVQRKVLFSQWNLLKSLGYGPAEFHHVSADFFREILHPDDQWATEGLCLKISTSKEDEIFNSTFRLRDKLGRYQRIAIRASVIRRSTNKAPLELMVSLMNVARYQCIKKQRDKNIAMMEDLSYRLSHELRAPVATILGLVKLLTSSYSGIDQPHLLELLEVTANKMDKVIKEFGDTLNANSRQMDVPVQAEQVIAETRHYSLKINIDKNRIYLKIKGHWRSRDSVPNYIADWKKALVNVKRNFTILTDASEMKTHPRDVREVHEEVQKMIHNAGIKKVAEVVNDDITTMQLDSMATITKFPKENFRSIEEAEAWLNRYASN